MTQQKIEPELSVVLCTYNGARFLSEQLRSIFDQTLLPGALIVSDDRSVDSTLDVLRQEAARRTGLARQVSIEVIPQHQDRLGPTLNFERGLRHTKTSIVALSDQDDVWEPHRLSRTVACLQRSPSVFLVASDTLLIDGRGRKMRGRVLSRFGLKRSERRQLAQGIAFPSMIKRNYLPGMTFTMRRALFDRFGPAPGPFMHDHWLALCAAACEGLHVVEEPLVRYRLHGSNVIGAGRRWAVLRAAKKVRDFFTNPRAGLPPRLEEWDAASPRLIRDDGLSPDSRELISEKLTFERTRYRKDRSFAEQIRVVSGLLRDGSYSRFDRNGVRAALDDLRWKREQK